MPTDTSLEAYATIQPSAESLREAVLAHITLVGSATCDEVEVELNMRHQTASARINELMKANLIVDGGDRRATRSGRKAIVWVAGA